MEARAQLKARDVLHLYLGCDVMVTPIESASFKCTLTGIQTSISDDPNDPKLYEVQVFEQDEDGGYAGHGLQWVNAEYVELILRPLSSMTEEEMLENTEVDIPNLQSSYEMLTPKAFLWLLSKGFDIFGLHDSQECLYEADLKKEL